MVNVTVKIQRSVNVKATLLKKGLQVKAAISINRGGENVQIKDQDENLITTVPPGGIYHVLVFDGIRDDGPPYTNSIVDNG